MNISTFAGDLLDLRPFSERLQKFIKVECDFVEGSLVLALSSRFGSGKTTFLRMWQKELENQEDAPLVISLNAWESDYYGDPLFAIVSALIRCLQEKKDDESANALLEAAKDIGWYATAIGNQIVQKFTGIDSIAAGAFAEEKKGNRQHRGDIPEDTFSVYEGRKDAMSKLKTAIRDFVKSPATRVLFLVDELDRCRPDYAISYLETIKHIFDIPGTVFILAADRQQLENSAKTAFGPNLDFEEYYRKFVHREITLPPISESGYKKLAAKYVNYYLQREGLRTCFMETESSRIDEIVMLVAALRLTPRQIQEAFRILGHIFETTKDQAGRLRWCFAAGSIAMAAFKVCNQKIYRLLGAQQFEPSEAAAFLRSLFGTSPYTEWWFALFLSGGGLKDEKNGSLRKAMKEVGLIADDAGSVQPSIPGEMLRGWGESTKRFAQICEKIEQIMQWHR